MQKEKILPQSPFTDPTDILLADVAIRVQLSRTDYNKAVSRYETVKNWIERSASPLKDRVQLFYPQGSMAIEATIASKLRTDEFDIDLVAQLDLPTNISPQEVLDLLFEAIRGEPGSRYHEMAKRRTRCVTINYSDDMHLDVTPMLRMEATPERQSWIFHHSPKMPWEPSCKIIANPYGFAQWFKESTPPDHDFANYFEKRAEDYERTHTLAGAESDPVPQQDPPFRKSKAVIVLQLLKRWRNVQYDTRSGRRPPSIMISKLVADSAKISGRLSEVLLLQAKHILFVFRSSHDQNRLVHISNPVCKQDVLTDRWPESLQDQELFIKDLEFLVQQVEQMVAGCDLAKMQKIMTSLFGESLANETVRAFNDRIGYGIRSGGSQHDPTRSGLLIGAATSTAPSVTRATPKHTFYGSERRKR